jgi:hypothetical protein
MVTVPAAATAGALIGNVALFAPGGTLTLVGIIPLVSLLFRSEFIVTVTPPDGAPADK